MRNCIFFLALVAPPAAAVALAEALDKEWSGAVPLTLLVKPGGELIFRREGKVDPLELKRAIVGFLGRT